MTGVRVGGAGSPTVDVTVLEWHSDMTAKILLIWQAGQRRLYCQYCRDVFGVGSVRAAYTEAPRCPGCDRPADDYGEQSVIVVDPAYKT